MQIKTRLCACVLAVALGAVGCSSTDKDPLALKAIEYLRKIVAKHAPSTPVAECDGGITFTGKCVAIRPAVESSLQRDGKHILTVRFEVAIDGSVDPRYTLGAIGIGDTASEAHQLVTQEWAAAFLIPFVSALLDLPTQHSTPRYSAYPGLLGIRGLHDSGAKPPEILSQDLLIRTADELLPDPYDKSFTTVSVMLAIDPNGNIDGECRKNGAPWPELLGRLKSFKSTQPAPQCLGKQYFLFVPKQKSK